MDNVIDLNSFRTKRKAAQDENYQAAVDIANDLCSSGFIRSDDYEAFLEEVVAIFSES